MGLEIMFLKTHVREVCDDGETPAGRGEGANTINNSQLGILPLPGDQEHRFLKFSNISLWTICPA